MAYIIFGFVMISLFEFSSGPITWLYLAEVMHVRSQSIATACNQAVNIAISYALPNIVKKFGNDSLAYLFYFTGVMTLISSAFIFCFMLETRGKTAMEIEEMFSGAGEAGKRILPGGRKLSHDDSEASGKRMINSTGNNSVATGKGNY